MHLLLIIITIITLGILYFISTRENFEQPKPPTVTIPQGPRKRPPAPYNPYIKLGDKRKTFFVAPNK